MAEKVYKVYRSETDNNEWRVHGYIKEFFWATPTNDETQKIGYHKGKKEAIVIQQLKDKRFCIFKRNAGANEKAGYKVYDKFLSLELDFEVSKDLRKISSFPLERHQIRHLLSAKKLEQGGFVTPEDLNPVSVLA